MIEKIQIGLKALFVPALILMLVIMFWSSDTEAIILSCAYALYTCFEIYIELEAEKTYSGYPVKVPEYNEANKLIADFVGGKSIFILLKIIAFLLYFICAYYCICVLENRSYAIIVLGWINMIYAGLDADVVFWEMLYQSK